MFTSIHSEFCKIARNESRYIPSENDFNDHWELFCMFLRSNNDDNKITLSMRNLEATSQLLDMGYTNLGKAHKIKLSIAKKFMMNYNTCKGWVEVLVTNNNGVDILVGKFDKEVHADKWIRTEYGSGLVTSLRYHKSVFKI
jgi:hypothetical protein